MIQTIDGPWTLCDDLGALFATSVCLMTKWADKQARGNRLLEEYGVPFYDDLDCHAKSFALADVTEALFDANTPLPETAWHAATLTAVCKSIEKSVVREIEMRRWSKHKLGFENYHCRDMIRAAYAASHEAPWWVENNDSDGFLRLAKRLTADFLPPAYFLLAEVEPEKRKNLMQRMQIPEDYFEMPFRVEKMTKTAMRERCRERLLRIFDRCMPFLVQGSTMATRPGATLETKT